MTSKCSVESSLDHQAYCCVAGASTWANRSHTDQGCLTRNNCGLESIELKVLNHFTLIMCCYFQIWIGTKDGTISILDQSTRKLVKSIREPHTDSIRSMCSAGERYVLTGAGSMDGTVGIWTTEAI